jgi:hypothetical protein
MLTLSGAATVAQYQAALRSVTFDNQSNDNPDKLRNHFHPYCHVAGG